MVRKRTKFTWPKLPRNKTKKLCRVLRTITGCACALIVCGSLAAGFMQTEFNAVKRPEGWVSSAGRFLDGTKGLFDLITKH